MLKFKNSLALLTKNLIVICLVDIILSFIVVTALRFMVKSYQFELGLITAFIFLALIYLVSWRQGFSDKNKVSFKRMKENIFIGLYAALIASIPGIILCIFYYYSIYGTLGYYPDINMYTSFWFSGYTMITDLYVKSYWYIIPLFLIPMPVVSTFGYILGFKDIRLKDKIIYKKTNK